MSCSKTELFNEVDFEEGDKAFVVVMKKNNRMIRVTRGFDWFELFGCLEMIKTDMTQIMMNGERNVKVTDITRIRIVDPDQSPACVQEEDTLK